jgi:hypothetical protein
VVDDWRFAAGWRRWVKVPVIVVRVYLHQKHVRQGMVQALHLSIRLGVVSCCCMVIRSHGFQYFLHDFC